MTSVTFRRCIADLVILVWRKTLQLLHNIVKKTYLKGSVCICEQLDNVY